MEKVQRLKAEYGLELTKEVEKEVDDMCTYSTAMVNKGMEKGMKQGMEQGRVQGENRVIALMNRLFSLGRAADVEKASRDSAFRSALFEEFGMGQG